MHPQAFLQTMWQAKLRPQIFVAMSFDRRYTRRFENVIAPAISGVRMGQLVLEPLRVDISKTGDPILTEIIDGIAHSQMVLADVSVVGKDSVTGHPYRNANVLYEVGIALACRQSSEVLLVRDDTDDFLFDISVVPHKTIDFENESLAVKTLRSEIIGRLKERELIADARVHMAIARLTPEDIDELVSTAIGTMSRVRDAAGRTPSMATSNIRQIAQSRLLDRQLVQLDESDTLLGTQKHEYRLTPFGSAVLSRLQAGPGAALLAKLKHRGNIKSG